jgi:hypothetical protein
MDATGITMTAPTIRLSVPPLIAPVTLPAPTDLSSSTDPLQATIDPSEPPAIEG